MASPAAGGVVLSGAAGVGKTRLAVECLRTAEAAGTPTARVSGTRSASGIAFGAVAPLLPPDAGAGSVPVERVAMLRRAAAAITQRGAGSRLVLMVDDAHLLDEASAILIHQLAQSRAVFVLATLRAGETAPDAVVSMWKDGAAERVDVHPLALDEVEALLAAAVGGAVDPASLRFLATRSEGNPLFLHELVVAAMETGALREQAGVVYLRGTLPPSNRLVELVKSRIQGLSCEEQNALDLLAFSESLGVGVLSSVTDPGILESLEDRGLITVSADRRRLDVQLAHPLHKDILRHRSGVLRSQAVKRALADALEATGARRQEDLLRLAAWRLEAGGDVNADLMLRAAEQARARGDYELAENLVSAAIDAGGGVEAALVAGQLLYLQGRGEEAEQRLAAVAEVVDNDVDRGRVAAARVENLWYGLGRRDEAIQVATEAEAAIADADIRDIVTARRVGIVQGVDHLRTVLDLIEPLLEKATGPALAWASVIGAVSLVQAGRTTEAMQVSERGLEVHRSLPPEALLWPPSIHEWAQAYALSESGQLVDAEMALRSSYERALAAGSLSAEPYLLWQMSIVLRSQGLVAASVRWARETVSLLLRTGWPRHLLRFAFADLAHALALLGQEAEAAEVMDLVDALPAPATGASFPANLVAARAWTAVVQGDRERALQTLEEAALDAQERGGSNLEIGALHDLARLGRAAAVVDRIEVLARSVDGPLARARAEHVRALVSGDAAALDAASRSFEALGALLLAAEAATEAAAAQRQAEGGRPAAAAERRAAGLAARCEGATTPALAAAAPGALSRREREIASLAAAGLANREIADRLFLSVRTVENQLQRVYEKLGVSSRGELRGVLAPS